METIFSKIISGEIPADIVYEDDAVLAFLDIRPTNKGHTLVIPKEAHRNIFDTPVPILGQLMETAQKIALAMRETLNADGMTVVMNNEHAGGQEVFHTHLHVIPRFENDNIFQKPTHEEYADGEMAELAEILRNAIS